MEQEISFEKFDKELSIEKEKVINEKLFKSSNNKIRTTAKRIQKFKESYIYIGEYYLYRVMPNNEWGVDIDTDNMVYIMNRLAPMNIKTFNLKNISSLTKFFELVVTAGKLILQEQDIDKKLTKEEQDELKKIADELIMKNLRG